MKKATVKMTEDNTEVKDGLKRYNLILNVNLMPLWGRIEEEEARYDGIGYLYIQVDYIIPIVAPDGSKLEKMSGGATSFMKISEVSEDKQITINAVYVGTYDETRETEIVSSSRIWVYELKE